MVGGERVGEFPVAEGGEVLCGGEGGGQAYRRRGSPGGEKQGHAATSRHKPETHWELGPQKPQFARCNFVKVFV